MAVGEKVNMADVNRAGNMNGELAGKIVFFDKASRKTDYSSFPSNPEYNAAEVDKIFAKAFLPAPLHRMPIGETNLIPDYEIRGKGATVLAPKPIAIGIYIDVDGVPQSNEHFCKDSFTGLEQEIRAKESESENNTGKLDMLKDEDEEAKKKEEKEKKNEQQAQQGDDNKYNLLNKPMKGSFYTFLVSKEQLPFCFIHVPLIGTLHDTNFSTGYYGENFIRCFCDMIRSLSPGSHKIDMRISYCYDHQEYNYLVLGKGSNTLGTWGKDLANSRLKEPHPKPENLEYSETMAEGSFTLHVPPGFSTNVAGMLDALDQKPPEEAFNERNAEKIRKIARVSSTSISRFHKKLLIRIVQSYS